MNDSKPQHKRLKETTTKPSGLIKDWQTKSISQGSWKGRAATPKNGPTQATPPEDVLGGLTDEDLDSQRPSSNESKAQDVIRTNEASISLFFSTI